MELVITTKCSKLILHCVENSNKQINICKLLCRVLASYRESQGLMIPGRPCLSRVLYQWMEKTLVKSIHRLVTPTQLERSKITLCHLGKSVVMAKPTYLGDCAPGEVYNSVYGMSYIRAAM
jgi:hypothetical protein